MLIEAREHDGPQKSKYVPLRKKRERLGHMQRNQTTSGEEWVGPDVQAEVGRGEALAVARLCA